MELIMKHKDVFSFCGKYGYTHYMEHRIKLKPGAQPIAVPQKPFNPALSKIVEQKTQEMLMDKVIEPAKPKQNMWNSRVVLYSKKAADGNWSDVRICVNYGLGNAVTKPDSYPIGDCAANLARLHMGVPFSAPQINAALTTSSRFTQRIGTSPPFPRNLEATSSAVYP